MIHNMPLHKKTWSAGTCTLLASGKPTSITVQLNDISLYPAIKQFAYNEDLIVTPSEKSNEWRIEYSGEDFDIAIYMLEQYLAKLYWAKKSKFSVGDRVGVYITPINYPFIDVEDKGIVLDILGLECYIIEFEQCGQVKGIDGKHLKLL